MNILLIGSGPATTQIQMMCRQHGHQISAALSSASPQLLEFFDSRAMIVVAPEATINIETLRQVAANGRWLCVIAGESDSLAAWAHAGGLPAFAYPPTRQDLDRLMQELGRLGAGMHAVAEQFRRTQLGSEGSARLLSGMGVRKIAVTSPKGGTGKTTTAVNLAIALAISGMNTFLIDADANAGALQYHLRMSWARSTLLGLLRRELSSMTSTPSIADLAAGARFLDAFTGIDRLPTLRVLPGIVTGELSDEALQNEEGIETVIQGLFDAGIAANGVVIMDVGINPAHPLHRAALRASEGIAIVIKPEIPDIAEVRRWLDRMVGSLAGKVGREAAFEFIGSRVKLCYNMVVAGGFKHVHRLLQRDLAEDDITLNLTPNGVLPEVESHAALQAVNSDRAEDIFTWRYYRSKPEELQAYTEALLDFACHFVPVVRESATRAGLIHPPKPRLAFLRRLFA